MKSCKNTSKICQKSLGVSIILKIYRKTKKGLCELFRKGLFCHTQEILRELFLILCYCFLILKIEIVSWTFSPIALSNDVFIPTFYPDLFRQIRMNDFRCWRPLSSFCVTSTCFCPKQWQIIVGVQSGIQEHFSQGTFMSCNSSHRSDSYRHLRKFPINIQMAICLVAAILKRMVRKSERG